MKHVSERTLLKCGIWAAVLYAAMNVGIPFLDPNYSIASQAPSELSAIGAPTRTVWVVFGAFYTALTLLFAWGIVRSARSDWRLKVVGYAVLVQGTFSIYWPPMHMRGEPFTQTDALHIVWTAVTVSCFLVAMAFSAAAFKRRFGIMTVVAALALLATGVMTSMQAPNIEMNLPTPTIGVWERISIGVYFAWSIALAVQLLRRSRVVADSER